MTTRLSWTVRKRLYQQASSQLDNGKTLTQILEDFRDRLLRRGRKKTAEAVHQVYRRVVDGETLMSAMRESLTDLERSILSSGEQAGQLANAMRLVLDVRNLTLRMRRALQASFFAPAVYMASLYVVLFVIGYYIVPQFTGAVPVSKWTGWAYFMYVLGELAVGWYAPVLIVLMIAAISVTWWALPRWTGTAKTPGRKFFDKYVFPFNVYREVTGFAWLVSFTTLIRAGVADTEALRGQISTASPWMASRLLPIQSGLRNGLDMAAAMRFSSYDFPSLDLIDEVGAYVGYSNFPEKIEAVSKEYANTLERSLIFKGAIVSAAFTGVMFLLMAALQLGANEISSILSSSMGAL
jgi:type II secretory pathway component PulF